MDDFIVGRKAIITYLRGPLDLSPDSRTAWNKIMRWRKHQGMDKLFHRDITGRPFIIAGEVREWMLNASCRRVHTAFIKGNKEIVPEKVE